MLSEGLDDLGDRVVELGRAGDIPDNREVCVAVRRLEVEDGDLAPPARNRSAVAAPMPRAPPVTSATRFSKS